MNIIAAVDPGLSGAIAWYWPDKPDYIRADDLPRMGDVIDGAQLATWLEQMRPDFVWMEAAGSMPSDGHRQAFRFGRAAGAVEGVLAALRIPCALVRPSTWKKDMRLSADKEQSRQMAIRQWPGSDCFKRKLDHNRSEAALIALWGSRQTFPAEMPEAAE